MERLILRNFLSPGDILMLTAAVRDLHLCNPGRFRTDVRTSCPDLWLHNPYITPVSDDARGVRIIDCEYPLIHRSNEAPYHFIHGFTRHLGQMLGVNVEPTLFRGDIHLSDQEKAARSLVHQRLGLNLPFWIIAAGGKLDFTIKWWSTERWQEVVDQFKGRILFVQVGESGHHHPPLRGVVDLRGKTSLRQLVQLVHHAQGVLCPVTSLMHLAAAVETRRFPNGVRPCVVVAGGREPPHWEAYPGHRFIHTMGSLACCNTGGCWRSRTLPLNDGNPKDHPSQRCIDVAGSLPRCMDIITPDHVISQIESYFQQGGPSRYLTVDEGLAVGGQLGWKRRALHFLKPRTDPGDLRWPRSAANEAPLTPQNAATRTEEALSTLPPPVSSYSGKGIVICGGGLRYGPSAWVNVRMLRHHGCRLPIELWHMPDEVDAVFEELLAGQGVLCVDANQRLKELNLPAVTTGWEMKPVAILYSSFREVLFLDADNMAVENPERLFKSRAYKKTGAVFWPDYTSLPEDDPIWKVCGVPYRDEPEFESGQILIDKVRHWKALQLSLWYNRHAAFFRHYFLGDKETFHFAFMFLEVEWATPPWAIENLAGKTMCQHDFEGRRIFQHRNFGKWSLHGPNPSVPGFLQEDLCLNYLAELRSLWEGRTVQAPRWHSSPARTKLVLIYAAKLTASRWHLSAENGESIRVIFRPDGRILSFPRSERFVYWDLKPAVNRPRLTLAADCGVTAELEFCGADGWRGIILAGSAQKRISVAARARKLDVDCRDATFRALTGCSWAFRIADQQQRTMRFNPDGTVGTGAGKLEAYWNLIREQGETRLELMSFDRLITVLHWTAGQCWEGAWPGSRQPALSLRQFGSSSVDPEPPGEGGTLPLLSLPNQRACESKWFGDWCEILREPLRFHRRQWEIVITLENVRGVMRQNRIDRVIVVNPADDSLVDALAGMGVEVVCVLNESWSNLPPTRRAHKLQSAKRAFNRRGLTAWERFAPLVRVIDSKLEIPEAELDAPSTTMLIWHHPSNATANGDEARPLGRLVAGMPAVRFTALTTNVLFQSAPDGPDDHMKTADLKEIQAAVCAKIGRGGKFRPAATLYPAADNGPVDTYIDRPPYQTSHHLKLWTPTGIVTTALVVWEDRRLRDATKAHASGRLGGKKKVLKPSPPNQNHTVPT